MAKDEQQDRRQRQDNGLLATAYVPLTDIDPEVGRHLLTALGRARIAAYLSVTGAPDTGTVARQRLYVASDDRVDARTIVAAAIRGIGAEQPELPEQSDPLDSDDTRAAFEALVADWRVDTIAAVREAERDLNREDSEWRSRLNRPQARDEVWLDEDHYVPPAPPPLPRLAAPTIIAMTVLAVSIVILGIGGQFGLASGLTFVLGICGILVGAGILFSRIREHRHDDEDDDGAAI